VPSRWHAKGLRSVTFRLPELTMAEFHKCFGVAQHGDNGEAASASRPQSLYRVHQRPKRSQRYPRAPWMHNGRWRTRQRAKARDGPDRKRPGLAAINVTDERIAARMELPVCPLASVT
jgi:hypothetical protein